MKNTRPVRLFSARLCRRQEAPIERALQGRLPTTQARELVRHLQHCPACLGYLTWAREHDDTLRSLLGEGLPGGLSGDRLVVSGRDPGPEGPICPIDLERARERLVELLASEARQSLSVSLLSLASWLFHHRAPREPEVYPGRLPPSRARIEKALAHSVSRVAGTPWAPETTLLAAPPVEPRHRTFHGPPRGTASFARALRLARWSGPRWLRDAGPGSTPPAPGAGSGPSHRTRLAREVLDEILTLTPSFHEARLLRGTTQRIEGYLEPDLLQEDWRELAVAEAAPTRALALGQEAGWVIQTGRGRRLALRRALGLFERATEIDPSQEHLHFNVWHLGAALGDRGLCRRAGIRLRRRHQETATGSALARRRRLAADACRASRTFTTIEEWSPARLEPRSRPSAFSPLDPLS